MLADRATSDSDDMLQIANAAGSSLLDEKKKKVLLLGAPALLNNLA